MDGCRIFNNADWWGEVKAVEFVSDIARHFRVSSMLAKERYDNYRSMVVRYKSIYFILPPPPPLRSLSLSLSLSLSPLPSLSQCETASIHRRGSELY